MVFLDDTRDPDPKDLHESHPSSSSDGDPPAMSWYRSKVTAQELDIEHVNSITL